jgi:hypothetical protein
MVHYELAQSIHCQNDAWFAGLEHLLLGKTANKKKVHSEQGVTAGIISM